MSRSVSKLPDYDLEICEVAITINLPEWIAESEWNYTVSYFYPEGHAWAGSYDRDEIGHYISDVLLSEEFSEADEICHHPWGPWLRFTFDDFKEAQAKTRQLKRKIARKLSALDPVLVPLEQRQAIRAELGVAPAEDATSLCPYRGGVRFLLCAAPCA